MEIADTGACHFLAPRLRGWIREDDPVMNVTRHLPHVAGMRFDNVDHIESHSLFVLCVQFVELGNLPAKGRSSIAAEDEHHGPLAAQRREPDAI